MKSHVYKRIEESKATSLCNRVSSNSWQSEPTGPLKPFFKRHSALARLDLARVALLAVRFVILGVTKNNPCSVIMDLLPYSKPSGRSLRDRVGRVWGKYSWNATFRQGQGLGPFDFVLRDRKLTASLLYSLISYLYLHGCSCTKSSVSGFC